MIAIIPTGGSNLGSVEAALHRLGADVLITEDPKVIARADRVIFPGVGHAETMMARLRGKNLDGFLQTLNQPVLGICLGMQLLFDSSEEGGVEGLGIIPGRVVSIAACDLPLPHMGWNEVKIKDGSQGPLEKIAHGKYFYFVHSFMAETGPWTKAHCQHGGEIPAIVQWRNYYGVQFHPERSGPAGAALLKEFLCMN